MLKIEVQLLPDQVLLVSNVLPVCINHHWFPQRFGGMGDEERELWMGTVDGKLIGSSMVVWFGRICRYFK